MNRKMVRGPLGAQVTRSSVLGGTGAPISSVLHARRPGCYSVENDTENMTRGETATGVVHEMPADFLKAIESDPIVEDVWADITLLARNEWICWVMSAKKDETRNRRITVGLDKMRRGMRGPCCWAGCPHR